MDITHCDPCRTGRPTVNSLSDWRPGLAGVKHLFLQQVRAPLSRRRLNPWSPSVVAHLSVFPLTLLCVSCCLSPFSFTILGEIRDGDGDPTRRDECSLVLVAGLVSPLFSASNGPAEQLTLQSQRCHHLWGSCIARPALGLRHLEYVKERNERRS